MKKAMTKLKMSLTNNVGIKIIAVLVAAIVWLFVINVNDPEKTVTIYNIPITMTDENVITDMGMVYHLESKNNVNITISGKRSVVSSLTADDFTATASLAELSKVNAIPVEISAKQNSIGRKITIVEQSLQTVTVSVENVEKQDFNIEVEFSGNPAEGYVAGAVSTSKNVISVKAPTSVLDRIARVAAVCDLDRANSDITQKCSLVLYDKRDKVIKLDEVEMSNKKVTVFVTILKEKTVPIKVNSIGNPADGYQVSKVTLSQKKVNLVGTAQALKDIEVLEVNDAVDITGANKDVVETVDLNTLLPEGVSINGNSEVEVTVKIDKLATKTYTIKADSISMENLKNGLSAAIQDKSIKVTLQGEQSVLNQITENDLRAGIDLKGYGKGTSKVPVAIVIPDGTELMGEITVKVKIK